MLPAHNGAAPADRVALLEDRFAPRAALPARSHLTHSYHENARWKGARAQSRRYALNERKAPSPRRTMAPAMIAPVIWPIPAAIAASPVGKSIRARPPRTNSQPRTVTSTGHPFVQRL